MKIRPYRLEYDDKWSSYPNLFKACLDLAIRLKAVGQLDLIDKGYFEQTEQACTKQIHTKRYCVEVYFPYTKFKIRKLSKGDFNQTELFETIRAVKEWIRERI